MNAKVLLATLISIYGKKLENWMPMKKQHFGQGHKNERIFVPVYFFLQAPALFFCVLLF